MSGVSCDEVGKSLYTSKKIMDHHVGLSLHYSFLKDNRRGEITFIGFFLGFMVCFFAVVILRLVIFCVKRYATIREINCWPKGLPL